MSTFALWRLFHRPGRSDTTARTSALAIIAFAAATAIFLTVLGGLHGFVWRAPPPTIPSVACSVPTPARPAPTRRSPRRLADDQMTQMASTYVVLAIFACVLLVVPFAALAGSAARLAASRRDTRLAALRLAGATTGPGGAADRARRGRPGVGRFADRHHRILCDYAVDHAAELPESAVHVRTAVGGVDCAGGRGGGRDRAGVGLGADHAAPRGDHPRWA